MSEPERPELAIARYRQALKTVPDKKARYGLLLGLAGAQADAGWFEEAVDSCREAIEADADNHAGFAMLATVLLDQGQITDASEAAFQALKRAPDDPATLNLATGVALRRGLAEAARKLSVACLTRSPTDQRALAHHAIALAQLGRDVEAKHLIDFDHLLKIDSPPPPPGFASIEVFNRVVVEALTGRTDLNTRHVARTLVGGSRLENTFALDAPVADALRGMFTQATHDYAAELVVTADHPMVKGKPGAFKISSWANIMDGTAYELPHMHPGSWLSGVYYPEIGAPAEGTEGGAIEFGGHDFGAAFTAAGPTRRVMPHAGMLVLFPSYFYHRTLPLDVPGRRISIAFDATAT
jgi:hypothetical protein